MNLSQSLIAWPIVDGLLAAFWFWQVNKAWHGVNPSSEENTDERALGATVIMGQLNAVITGASIIIAGIAAFVALGKGTIEDPQKYHLFYAALWAVGALAISQYTMGILPTRTKVENFVASRVVAVLCAMALFFSLFAGVRLLFGVASFLGIFS